VKEYNSQQRKHIKCFILKNHSLKQVSFGTDASFALLMCVEYDVTLVNTYGDLC
jgi:hypothetical protein